MTASLTSLTALFGIERAIIQAPMAGVQDARLAIAVGSAGGLGSLPAAMLAPEALRRELTALRATGQPYNVNFFCHTLPAVDEPRRARWLARLAPYYAEVGVAPPPPPTAPARLPFDAATAELVAAFAPPVVSFHFGLPDDALLARVRGWGAKVIASATTVAEARYLAARGVDAIIAQGLEAGGHRGTFLDADPSLQLGTFALVPQIVAATGLPTIAAGGIADARGVAAARALGAAGVQVGTAYLLCPEATTRPLHRAALARPEVHTAVTTVLTGKPARGIVNRAIRELAPFRDEVPAFPGAADAIVPLRDAAEAAGRDEFSTMWAGQNTAGCRSIGAAALTRELMS